MKAEDLTDLEILEELRRRLGAEKRPNPSLLDAPSVIAEYLQLRYCQPDQEIMGALYLDCRCRLLGEVELFRGTLTGTRVDPKPIIKQALLRSAHGFILFHNHPSGDTSPSAEDLAFTRRIAEAAELMGLVMHDHLILGGGGKWLSLKRRGAW